MINMQTFAPVVNSHISYVAAWADTQVNSVKFIIHQDFYIKN